MGCTFIVFYAGLVYGEYSYDEFHQLRSTSNSELYNGGIVYVTYKNPNWRPRFLDEGWYRMDGTPMLIEDVPKEYQTILLLLS